MIIGNIPDVLGEAENLVRIIFSPFHIDKKNPTKLTPNAFRPPSGIDEVSVNRLFYTTENACKAHGRNMNSANKIFFGLACISYAAVLSAKAFARVSKLDNNPAHADIYFGIILQKGEPAPAEINFALKELVAKANYFSDPNPESEMWTGGDVNSW